MRCRLPQPTASVMPTRAQHVLNKRIICFIAANRSPGGSGTVQALRRARTRILYSPSTFSAHPRRACEHCPDVVESLARIPARGRGVIGSAENGRSAQAIDAHRGRAGASGSAARPRSPAESAAVAPGFSSSVRRRTHVMRCSSDARPRDSRED